MKRILDFKYKMKEEESSQLAGDTEEISALLVTLVLIEWVIYMAALPVFLRDILYYPAWINGLLGFLYLSYFLIEIGFLKIFYGFRNDKLVQRRIELRDRERYSTEGPDTKTESLDEVISDKDKLEQPKTDELNDVDQSLVETVISEQEKADTSPKCIVTFYS